MSLVKAAICIGKVVAYRGLKLILKGYTGHPKWTVNHLCTTYCTSLVYAEKRQCFLPEGRVGMIEYSKLDLNSLGLARQLQTR